MNFHRGIEMSTNREEDIRRRAHEIWEGEGRPEGKDAEHWERAAREIGGDGAAKADSALGGAAEGSKTERVAEGLKSGKSGRS
jgi:hypothetical protein